MNFLVFIFISLRKTTNILDILYRVRDFFMIFLRERKSRETSGEEGLWGWVVGMGCGDGLWGWVVGMGGDRRHSGGF